jgi:hypothetical protein
MPHQVNVRKVAPPRLNRLASAYADEGLSYGVDAGQDEVDTGQELLAVVVAR